MSLPRISTTVDIRDPSFCERDAAFRDFIADFTAQMNRAALGGPEGTRIRHQDRGKLLPRDRVTHLLDPGSPFSNSHLWQRMGCTTMRHQVQG